MGRCSSQRCRPFTERSAFHWQRSYFVGHVLQFGSDSHFPAEMDQQCNQTVQGSARLQQRVARP